MARQNSDGSWSSDGVTGNYGSEMEANRASQQRYQADVDSMADSFHGIAAAWKANKIAGERLKAALRRRDERLDKAARKKFSEEEYKRCLDNMREINNLLESGDYTKAINHYENTINFLEPKGRLGAHCLSIDLEDDKEKIPQLIKETAHCYFKRGTAAAEKGDYAEAVKDLRIAAAYDPDNADLTNSLNDYLEQLEAQASGGDIKAIARLMQTLYGPVFADTLIKIGLGASISYDMDNRIKDVQNRIIVTEDGNINYFVISEGEQKIRLKPNTLTSNFIPKKDYSSVLEMCKKAGENGDKEACLLMAEYFYRDKDAKDKQDILYWSKKAGNYKTAGKIYRQTKNIVNQEKKEATLLYRITDTIAESGFLFFLALGIMVAGFTFLAMEIYNNFLFPLGKGDWFYTTICVAGVVVAFFIIFGSIYNRLRYIFLLMAILTVSGWIFMYRSNTDKQVFPTFAYTYFNVDMDLIEAKDIMLIVTINELNIYTSASEDSAVVKKLSSGDLIAVAGEAANGWIAVEHMGAEGWVSTEYAKKINPISIAQGLYGQIKNWVVPMIDKFSSRTEKTD
jgi:tetratricopeptide (TPR) repeat protein